VALRVLLGFQRVDVVYEYDFQIFLRPMSKFFSGRVRTAHHLPRPRVRDAHPANRL
jgi:hypothetical protein